jgi:uroporphyrinogen decarboxylase
MAGNTMTPQQRIRNIIARRPADRCGFWLGNPHPDTLPGYFRHFGVSTLEELHRTLGSDFRWISPQLMDSSYADPAGHGLFDARRDKTALGDPGPLAQCESISDLENAYHWPSVDHIRLDGTIAALRAAEGLYRAGGYWAPFFHDVADLFGFEEMLVRMHTQPEIVEAAFERVCTFYLEANARLYDAAGGEMDAYFFGNDLGTQRGLMVSPVDLERFIMPWVRRLTAQARERGYQVILHSCGSVHQVIGQFISAGIECLHPLQARAEGMSAATLGRDFNGAIAFLGGVDTQELLVHGSPDDIRVEVRRLKQLLGPHFIISPSHEAILPNVPPENVQAMAEEAAEH